MSADDPRRDGDDPRVSADDPRRDSNDPRRSDERYRVSLQAAAGRSTFCLLTSDF